MDERDHRAAIRNEERDGRALNLIDGSDALAAGIANETSDAARRARFIEALDRVMTKHRNVLAALAK